MLAGLAHAAQVMPPDEVPTPIGLTIAALALGYLAWRKVREMRHDP